MDETLIIESSSEYEDFDIRPKNEKTMKDLKNEGLKNRQDLSQSEQQPATTVNGTQDSGTTIVGTFQAVAEETNILKDVRKKTRSNLRNKGIDLSLIADGEANNLNNSDENPRRFLSHNSLLPLFDSDSDSIPNDSRSSDEELERASLSTFIKKKEKHKRPPRKRKDLKKLDKVSHAFSKTNISGLHGDNTSIVDDMQPETSSEIHDIVDGADRHRTYCPRSKKNHRRYLNGRRQGMKRPRESSEDGASGPAHEPIPVTVALHHMRKGRGRSRNRSRTNEDLLNSSSETEIPQQTTNDNNDSMHSININWIASPPRVRNGTTPRSSRRRTSRSNATRTRESLGAASSFTPETQRTINQFQQIQDDEDMARQLQEEMDHEFAVSLNTQGSTSPCVNCSRVHGPDETNHHHHHHHRPNNRSNHEIPYNELPSYTMDHSIISQLVGLDDQTPFFQPVTISPPRSGRNRRGSSNRSRGRTAAFQRARFLAAVDTDSYENLLALGEAIGDVVPRGLETSVINQLPTHKFDPSSARSRECSICMSEFEINDRLRILPCFHDFHVKCIDQWIQSNATCPICRVTVQIQ